MTCSEVAGLHHVATFLSPGFPLRILFTCILQIRILARSLTVHPRRCKGKGVIRHLITGPSVIIVVLAIKVSAQAGQITGLVQFLRSNDVYSVLLIVFYREAETVGASKKEHTSFEHFQALDD